MHLEDNFVVEAPVKKVWQFVTTPNDFAKTIPDLQKHEVINENQFKAAFRIGLGMIKGTMNMTFKFEDKRPMDFIRVVGRGSGPQSTTDITLSLTLSPLDEKTKIAWTADIIVGGLVASVGSRLLESTAKSKVREVVEGIKRELEK